MESKEAKEPMVPMANGGWIQSVHLRHPTQERDLEVRFETEEYREIDAVFTTVNAARRILVPFYDERDGAELDRQIEEQQLDGVCLALHRKVCGFIVPGIDWNTRSVIRL